MVRRTYEQARRMSAPRALALCQNFGGALDFQAGRWEQAEADLRGAVALYRQLGAASGEALSLQRLGVLLTARGRLVEAMSLYDEGLVVAERATLRSHCLLRLQASAARNRLAAGDVAGAQAWVKIGLETGRRHGNCVTCNALLLPEAVRVAILERRLDEADLHARELERRAGGFGSQAWLAMAGHARGRVHSARGSWEAAVKALREAARAYLAIDDAYDAARCWLAEAAALRVRGAADLEPEAAALEARAKETFASLGAAGIED